MKMKMLYRGRGWLFGKDDGVRGRKKKSWEKKENEIEKEVRENQ